MCIRDSLGTRYPVEDGVVDLGHQGDVSVLEPLDHMELPQGPAPVERVRCQVPDQRHQLGLPPRTGKPHPADVEVDIELGVVDHQRVLEPEGHLEHPLPERGHQMDPIGDRVTDPPEAHPTGHLGGIEDQRAGVNLPVRAGRPWPGRPTPDRNPVCLLYTSRCV